MNENLEYIVVTMINPDGESDLMWLELPDDIGESCVALTQPAAYKLALKILDEMKIERQEDQYENQSIHIGIY